MLAPCSYAAAGPAAILAGSTMTLPTCSASRSAAVSVVTAWFDQEGVWVDPDAVVIAAGDEHATAGERCGCSEGPYAVAGHERVEAPSIGGQHVDAGSASHDHLAAAGTSYCLGELVPACAHRRPGCQRECRQVEDLWAGQYVSVVGGAAEHEDAPVVQRDDGMLEPRGAHRWSIVPGVRSRVVNDRRGQAVAVAGIPTAGYQDGAVGQRDGGGRVARPRHRPARAERIRRSIEDLHAGGYLARRRPAARDQHP